MSGGFGRREQRVGIGNGNGGGGRGGKGIGERRTRKGMDIRVRKRGGRKRRGSSDDPGRGVRAKGQERIIIGVKQEGTV